MILSVLKVIKFMQKLSDKKHSKICYHYLLNTCY